MSETTNKTNLTIKMDKSTREAFNLLCNNIGISMSAGIIALMRQAIRDQALRFTLFDENGFDYYEAKELKHRIEDLQNGNGVTHDLIEE